MATLDQWIGYTDAARAVLQEVQVLKGAIDELGSDPLGVLSVVNLEGLLSAPVAKRIPVVKIPQVKDVDPGKLPDLDLPKPRTFDPEPEAEKPEGKIVHDTKVTRVEVVPEKLEVIDEDKEKWEPIRGGKKHTNDPVSSFEMAPPIQRTKSLVDIGGGVQVTKHTQKALLFLYEILADEPQPRVTILEEGKKRGISWYAINEARRYSSDIKTKIVGIRGMHWFYMVGQEDKLPNINGNASRVKQEAESGRGLNPDEVNVLMQLEGGASVAQVIGRSGLAPQKVKDALEFLMRRKLALLDKGANVWRPMMEVVQA